MHISYLSKCKNHLDEVFVNESLVVLVREGGRGVLSQVVVHIDFYVEVIIAHSMRTFLNCDLRDESL